MISTKLVEVFNDKLKESKLTIFCGESITAGLLASTIASVSGASDVLAGSIVTYDERVKTALLGVSVQLLHQYTAESQEVTSAMCEGLRKCFPIAEIYVAVTGVASESVNGYKTRKPVGQIYVSIWYDQLFEFSAILSAKGSKNKRNVIREKTVLFILEKIATLLPDPVNVVSD